MSNTPLLFIIFLSQLSLNAQSFDDFRIIYKIESSDLKDQQSSGTCWSFASTSFIETEAIRLNHTPISLSAMYYVAPTYLAKAEKFISTKGDSYFDAGDLTFSVLDAYQTYGAIPESVYNGMNKDDWQHDHLEMDNLLYAMVESIGTSGYGRIKPNSWKQAIQGVLHTYLGIAPATFIHNGELHTPKSFADKFIGIKAEDYIELTSYSDHDFYDMCSLNIPANWDNNLYLNLPLDQFISTIDYALANGYSLAWDGDVTEPHFHMDKGIFKLDPTSEESLITQSMRQSTFDDQTTTDDHNMHLIGKATGPDLKEYYLFKNSEGINDMKGYIFMTKNALLLKTISVTIHKDAIPVDVTSNSKLMIDE